MPDNTRDGLNERRKEIFFGLVLFAGVCLAYAPALFGGFLWDDDGHICAPALRSLRGLWHIWTRLGATQQYYPLLHSAFWLEYQVWGEAVFGYHLVNVVLHASSALLISKIMRRLGLSGGWLAAAIFAFHPVCVESVAWISEQKNTLSTFFALLAVLRFLTFSEDRNRDTYLSASAFFICALLTKSVTAMVPVALLAVLWWKQGDLKWRRDVFPLIPWVVVGAASGLLTAWVERTYIGASGSDFALSTGQRLVLAGQTTCFYACKLVWPTPLVFIYPRWTPDASNAQHFLCIGLVLCSLTATWLLRHRTRAPFTACIAFMVLLFPVMGFVNVYPFRFSYVADHFQYLASIPVFICFSAAVTRFASLSALKVPIWGQVASGFGVAVLLAVLTFRQAGLYVDSITLYRSTLLANPNCWLALNNLGNILGENSYQAPEAISCFKRALELRPDYVEARFNLANTLARLPDRRAEALQEYRKAIEQRPAYAEAHNNLGSLLGSDPTQRAEALAEFDAALKIKPDFAPAHANLATALAKIPGQESEARSHFETALRLDPDSAKCHFNFANMLARSDADKDAAIVHFERALALRPDFAEAHFNLSVLLSSIPTRQTDALGHCQAAVELRPDWTFAREFLSKLEQRKAQAN